MEKKDVPARELNNVVKPALAVLTTNFIGEAHNRNAVFCLLAAPKGMYHTLMKNKDKPQTWGKVATSDEWLGLIPASHEISRVIIAKKPGKPEGGSLVFNSRNEALRSGVKIRCNGTIHPEVTIPPNLR